MRSTSGMTPEEIEQYGKATLALMDKDTVKRLVTDLKELKADAKVAEVMSAMFFVVSSLGMRAKAEGQMTFGDFEELSVYMLRRAFRAMQEVKCQTTPTPIKN